MAWWSMIVLSCLFSIVFAYRAIPNLSRSTEILYGLGLAVALASGMVDSRQDANPEIKNDKISRNQPSQGFWVDILSDNNGMSWPRLQNVLCNLGFGLYFLYCTWYNLALPFHPAIGKTPAFTIDDIMPVINDSSLFMMGISNVAYVGFKVNENKPEAK